MTDPRLDAPAFHRNAAPIAAELRRLLAGQTGHVLEIGSGTGQHIKEFAAALPHLNWWPTDPDPARRASIAAYSDDANLPNLNAPTDLDVLQPWPLGQPDHPPTDLTAILAINVIHIAPWPVTEHLIENAARHLSPGCHLILYGPFKQNGAHTAPSNAAFDESLRARDPTWGLRDLTEVKHLAMVHSLRDGERMDLPANNLVVSFRQPSG